MKKYLILLFVAAAAVFQSCDNNDDLWDAIDDLKSRVQALETQVNALNGNIDALQKLYSGASVSNVDINNETGKTTITLANGDILTLVSDIDALVPKISINENGMWECTVNGETTTLGKAVAEDGKTPKFQVDDEGYWQVNLGDGKWQYVYYANTTDKVSAITNKPTEDKFFQTVEVVDDSLHIVMQNGEVLDVPIIKDFLCQIVDGEGHAITDVQSFDMGITKKFTVNMRGVENWILTAPEGWTAELSEPTDGADGLKVFELSVTSPAPTRATASTAKDVSILATSGKYSCIAKIQVESTGIDPNAPRITVTTSTSVAPTYATLTFDVELVNTTTWKYICQPSSEQAPTADEIMASGTDGSGTSVTVSGLEGETDYTIYVVAYDGAAVSDVASAQNRTLVAPVDYYTKGVDINGVIYNSESVGATTSEIASEATTDYTITAPNTPTVRFIGRDNSDSYGYVMAPTSSIAILADNIYIGRYSDEKPTIKIGRFLALRNPGGTVAFKNLVLNFETEQESYLFNFSGTGGIGTLIFEDCEIVFSDNAKATSSMSFITGYNGTGTIGNIIFRNCKIRYTGSTTAYILNFTNSGSLDFSGLASVVLENNIIYSTQCSGKNCAFMSANNLDLSSMALTVERNTFVDLRGAGTTVNTSALFVLKQFGSISCKNNIFYSTTNSSYPTVFSLTYDYADVWQIDMERTSNLAWGGSAWKMYSQISNVFYPGSSDEPKPTITIPFAQSNPLTTCNPADGVFVVDSEYAGTYGSTLE